jgi:hypothetical protein
MYYKVLIHKARFPVHAAPHKLRDMFTARHLGREPIKLRHFSLLTYHLFYLLLLPMLYMKYHISQKYFTLLRNGGKAGAVWMSFKNRGSRNRKMHE